MLKRYRFKYNLKIPKM